MRPRRRQPKKSCALRSSVLEKRSRQRAQAWTAVYLRMRAATCAALLGRGACRAPHVSRLRRARRNTGTCAAASVADDGYDTLAAPLVHETEVKKSRFIAHAAHAASPSAALAFVAERRDAQARHNCWAYRCGSEFRSSDDGEPSGTAGRPILSAIEGAGLDHVVVLVVRWFGGIKLGAGGLTRGALLGTAPAQPTRRLC